MGRSRPIRYGDVAVSFHWLIAILIITLLAVGKFMTELDENDPLRFTLTQWHKSFGITVLALSVLRLIWRWTHKTPAHPAGAPGWEKLAANLAHFGLYALMFILPLSGWMYVSASPLNIDTLLFNVIELPHIAPLESVADKEAVAHRLGTVHTWAGNLLILIVLAHIGAALKHHLIEKDDILRRILPNWSSPVFRKGLVLFVVGVGAAGSGLYLYADAGRKAAVLAAGDSAVSFVATISGDEEPGLFTQSVVTASINEADPSKSTLSAIVTTESITSDNPQLASSLPDEEWFDVETHPQATFESTEIAAGADGTLQVMGTLTIKKASIDVAFPMTLTDEDGERVARGEFTVDRRKFNIGMESQDDDGTVSFDVLIRFRFGITAENDSPAS